MMQKLPVIIFFALLAFPFQAYAEKSASSPAFGKDFFKSSDFKVIAKDDNFYYASRAAVPEKIRALLEQKLKLSEEQREALKEKLEQFKDTKKKTGVFNIDSKIASISSRRVADMASASAKMQSVLDVIKEKAAALNANCDKTGLNNAITEAEKAIASASAVIDAQAKKTYQMNISDESTAKINVGQVVKQLQQDLRDTHKAVINAKQAIMKAAVELRKVQKCARPSTSPALSPSASPTVVPNITTAPTSAQ